MNIFESLENLNVSEECFDDIMGIVEELLSEDVYSAIDKYAPEKDRERLRNKAGIALSKEAASVVDRKIAGINKKAFHQYRDKTPEQVKKEFMKKEFKELGDKRGTNKNSKGMAATDIRRVQSKYPSETREQRNKDSILKSNDAREAIRGRVDRNNKMYDEFRKEKSIKTKNIRILSLGVNYVRI